VKITPSTLVFNRSNGTWSGTISLKNISGSALVWPLTLQLLKLPAGVSGLDAAGTLPGIGPYYTVHGSGPLAVGGTATVIVRFNAGSSTRVTFNEKVYSGQF
jgi:hypothetical protein